MQKTWKQPKWWNKEHDSAWERVKEAFRRDWEQTKHDFGGDAPDLDQNVDDTVAQAAGSRPVPPPHEPNFDEYEPALRYGYAARRQYGTRYTTWNLPLEKELRADFGDEDWDYYYPAIRHGWEFDAKKSGRKGPVIK